MYNILNIDYFNYMFDHCIYYTIVIGDEFDYVKSYEKSG